MATKEYMLILHGNVSMLDWRCTLFEPSDEAARQYVHRALEHDPAARGALSAELFNVTENTHVGSFVMNTVTHVRPAGAWLEKKVHIGDQDV